MTGHQKSQFAMTWCLVLISKWRIYGKKWPENRQNLKKWHFDGKFFKKYHCVGVDFWCESLYSSSLSVTCSEAKSIEKRVDFVAKNWKILWTDIFLANLEVIFSSTRFLLVIIVGKWVSKVVKISCCSFVVSNSAF